MVAGIREEVACSAPTTTAADADRSGHADGRAVPALLDAGAAQPRRCPSRTAPPVRVTRARRGPGGVPRHERPGRPGRPPLRAPRRRPVLRAQRGVRPALRVPRLEVRRRRPVRRHPDDGARRGPARPRRASPPTRRGSAATSCGPTSGRPSTEPPLPGAGVRRAGRRRTASCPRSCRSATGRRRARARSTPPTSRSCTRRSRSPDIPPERRTPPARRRDALDEGRPGARCSTSSTTTPAWCSAASRRADDDDLYWRITQYLLPNHSLAPGSAPGDIYFGQTWVPIDDRSCWVYVYSWNPDRPLDRREDRFIPGVPSVHAEVDEHWVPIRNRANDYLIDREAQRTRSFTGHRGPLRAGRRDPGQPGPHRRPHPRAPRPDRPRHRALPPLRPRRRQGPRRRRASRRRRRGRTPTASAAAGSCMPADQEVPAVLRARFGESVQHRRLDRSDGMDT